jgi:hypothetical protein
MRVIVFGDKQVTVDEHGQQVNEEVNSHQHNGVEGAVIEVPSIGKGCFSSDRVLPLLSESCRVDNIEGVQEDAEGT